MALIVNLIPPNFVVTIPSESDPVFQLHLCSQKSVCLTSKDPDRLVPDLLFPRQDEGSVVPFTAPQYVVEPEK